MQASLFDLDLSVAEASPAPVPVVPPRRPLAPVRPRPPTLLAVDGNSLAHRAFHAYRDVVDGDGRPRGAIYGFLALLTGICDLVDPAGVVVGMDCGRTSQRRATYPAYKAQRPDKDPALVLQLDDLCCLLARLGVTVVRPAGWEADDVLGSAAATAEGAGWHCVVATSDRDAYQLLSPATSLLRLGSGLDAAVTVTPAVLQRSTGVRPEQYVEYAALRGDASDNLPGVPGIGPKRARLLLREYATVAEAGADPIGCRSVLGRPEGQALLDDLADPATSVFHRNVELMTIRRDLDLDLATTAPMEHPDTVELHLLAWELPTLVRRCQVALALRPDRPPPLGDEHAPAVHGG